MLTQVYLALDCRKEGNFRSSDDTSGKPAGSAEVSSASWAAARPREWDARAPGVCTLQPFCQSAGERFSLNSNTAKRSPSRRPGCSGSFNFRLVLTRLFGFNPSEHHSQGNIKCVPHVISRLCSDLLPKSWHSLQSGKRFC